MENFKSAGKSVWAQNVREGQMLEALIWHTHTRRSKIIVHVDKIEGRRIQTGLKITTNEFEAFSENGAMRIVDHRGKHIRVTFGMLNVPDGKELSSTTSDNGKVTFGFTDIVVPKKRIRKPLTRAQKDRKNELERARRAAKKAAK